jgi:hypothetical protein
MLQSLTSSFNRARAERPSGAYMHNPGRDDATAPIRKRKTPAPAPMAPKEQRETLRHSLQVAMNERRYNDALNHILGLVALDPNDPRWPHKYGDVLRSLRRHNEAAAAYRRAARRYDAAGFPVRATAMVRLAVELEGERGPRPHDQDSGTRLISGRSEETVPLSDDETKPLTEIG